jgi:adenylate cyclase class IV
LEIEAIGDEGQETELDHQCKYYMGLLGIADDQLLSVSYSDLLLEKNK